MASKAIIRKPEALALTGLSRSTFDRKVKSGEFPAPIALSARCRGWILGEVENWIEARILSRDKRTDGSSSCNANFQGGS